MKKFYLLLMFAGISVFAQNAWRPLGPGVLDQLSPDGTGGPVELDNTDTPYVYCNGRLLAFNSGGWQQIGDSNSETYAFDLVFDSANTPVIAASDSDAGFSVKKMIAGVWQPVGNFTISAGPVIDAILAISPSDEIYIAYTVGWDVYDLFIKKFDGMGWSDVGNIASAAVPMSLCSLRFGPSGELYVAGTDMFQNYNAIVMKLNGTSWENVGQPFPSSTPVLSFDFASNGDPYLLTRTGFNQSPTLLKYEGGSWVTVMQLPAEYTSVIFMNIGTDSSIYLTYYTAVNDVEVIKTVKLTGGDFVEIGSHEIWGGVSFEVELNSNNDPVIAYRTNVLSGFNVLRYESGALVQLGNAGFSDEYVDAQQAIPFEINHHNIPYLAYRKNQNQGVVIRKFNGSSWEEVGNDCPGSFPDKILFDSLDQTYVLTRTYTSDGFSAWLNRFSGTTWENIYQSNSLHDVAIASNDDVYLLEGDAVKKYDGIGWQTLPSFLGPSASVYRQHIRLDSQNRPYVLTQTISDENIFICQFKRFESGNWQDVGSSFTIPTSSMDVTYELTGDDTLYYAYISDVDFSLKLTRIMNSQTVMLGGITETPLGLPTWAVDQNGTPYVAFTRANAVTNEIYYPLAYKFNGLSWELVDDMVVDCVGFGTNIRVSNFNQPLTAFFNRGFYVYYYGEQDSYTLGLTDQIGNQSHRITLSPNPARSLVSIHSQLPVEEVVIYDLSGKKIHSVKNTNQVSVENLSPGLYIAKVKTGNGIQSLKLIKE
ncbi:hypothetical protein FLLO111716_03345 [Flavobacterium longum]|uniref:T9SS type A sorting domain-containing protein n=1 Tax=Flavobacterium longum TaxID=1299340 RepID=UPI0039E8CFA5